MKRHQTETVASEGARKISNEDGMTKPLMFDLCCGLGGATEGFLAEGWHCIGVDIERHQYGEHKYPAQLWIQDLLTIHGSQLRDANFIWASPPCQEFSYMAMPWAKAKHIAKDYRDGTRDVRRLTALFDACFRIQREACDAAGRHIPLVVENVRGAIPWVGRSRWNFGSFHLWGDVPALMPAGKHRKQDGDSSWFYANYENSARRFSSNSKERRQWSALIAKIPLPLSRHIAQVFKPVSAAVNNHAA